MFGKRLTRQLKKSFGVETPEQICALESAQLTENFTSFLALIEDAYKQLDDKLELAERNLEVSSSELTSANSNLFLLNQSFDAMINSLGQGFLLFGEDRVCLPVASKVCENLLECQPAGTEIDKVLRIPPDEKDDFANWCKMMFDERIAFADMAALGPSRFAHSDCERVIDLEYKPCRDRNGKISAIVVVATDKTAEFTARRQAMELEAHVKMMTSILKNKNRFRQFVSEMRRMLSELKALTQSAQFDGTKLDCAKRLLHTMKGVSGAFGLMRVKSACHEAESRLNGEQDVRPQVKILRESWQSIRAEFESLLETNREIIGDIGGGKREIEAAVLEGFLQSILSVSNNEDLARIYRTQILAVPLRKLFSEYDSYVSDMALQLGKKVAPIRFTGHEPRVIESELKPLLSVLPHLFSNIVDHGIENEELRIAKGKAAAGSIEVKFEQDQNGLKVTISDDGKGIDIPSLRVKLEAAGERKLALQGSDAEIVEQIFRPGLSTRKNVSEFSGRGIGMDAVRSEVQKLGGRISVTSAQDRGTIFCIELPQTDWLQADLRTAS